MIDAYPLSWPAGWPRTAPSRRQRARFHGTTRKSYNYDPTKTYLDKTDLTVAEAVRRLVAELDRLGAKRTVISTNVELRRDGLPMSGRRAPDDPGVAVYWTLSGEAQCMAIDIYDTVAGNLAAVAASIDAMRAIERHGGAQILKRAFQGFKALPSATVAALNVEQAAAIIARRALNGSHTEHSIDMVASDIGWARDLYRRAAAKAHPDAGGSTEDFQLVQEAKRVLEAHHGGSL